MPKEQSSNVLVELVTNSPCSSDMVVNW